jgi:hypothetical protein
MNNSARTYLNTLLHRKRGSYGPLWVFELDPTTWVVVSSALLGDEANCRSILSEDPNWFNRDWGTDGRRPNPTYKTQHEVLQEVIRLLWSMKNELQHDDAEQTRYTVYISNAEHDLHQALTSQQSSTEHRDECTTQMSETAASQEDVQAEQTPEPAQPPAEVEKTPPAPALQATEAKPKPKPWEDLSAGAKGLNLPMSPELYAKMLWCTNNIPKMSLQKLARMGAEKMADELIAKYYKGESS